MPKGYTLKPAAQAMTPLELADFTSGLPDDPTNIPAKLEQRSIKEYTANDFLTWISSWTPTTPIPAPFLYSNSGVGLLGYLLETATGKSWENQVTAEIIRPLGMVDTTLYPTTEQQARLAQGHLKDGAIAPSWPVFAWYAAGGFRSTPRDMLSFAEANIGHRTVNGKSMPADLIRAMKDAQRPIYTMPKAYNKQAMAWINNVGDASRSDLRPVIFKDGETAGFSTALILNPDKDLAMFVAINQAGAAPVGKGIEIARQIK